MRIFAIGIDMDDWMLGTIAWNVEDLIDVLTFEEKLLRAPKDDWDLTVDPKIDFEKQFRDCDSFHSNTHVIAYLAEKYAGQIDLVRAYSFRYLLIKELYTKHLADLHVHNLVENVGGQLAISPGLLDALSTLPFSDECTRSGTASRRFNIAEVIGRAHQVDEM